MGDETENRDQGGSFWLRVMESKGFTTIMTVVIGGIIGQLIISSYQAKTERRQLALAAYEKHLSEGMEHVKKAFTVAGEMIAAAENLDAITGPEWKPDRYEPERAARVSAERQRIVEAFNTTITGWQRERDAIALMMGYFLNTGAIDFGRLWRDAQRTIDSYTSCVKACYQANEYAATPAYAGCACDSLKQVAWSALDNFNGRVLSSRIYLWDGND